MARGNVETWLEPRLVGAPVELAAAVRELLGEVEADADGRFPDVPEALVAAALLGFDGVLEPVDAAREVALRLLAADAALTYAFEAAASLGRDVDGLAMRIGPGGELGRRLDQGVAGPADGGVF